MTIDSNNKSYRLKLADELTLLQRALEKCSISHKSIGSIDRARKQLKDDNILPPTKLDEKLNPPQVVYLNLLHQSH